LYIFSATSFGQHSPSSERKWHKEIYTYVKVRSFESCIQWTKLAAKDIKMLIYAADIMMSIYAAGITKSIHTDDITMSIYAVDITMLIYAADITAVRIL
jgi:hypothetical protein